MVHKENIGVNKVLVIAVHPDDETLGAGGTLLKHKSIGDKIHWLICTTLNEKHNYYNERLEEIKKVSKIYDFESVHNLQLQTMHIDEYSMFELVGKLSFVINEVKPNVIYFPFFKDVHSDHKKIFEAAYSCTKSFRYPFIKKIYMMETLSETEFAPSLSSESFVPNVFVDISDFFEKKIDIMKLFKSEIAEHPFPRSIQNMKALAILRGASSGCKYAESFVLLKEIF